MTGRIKFPCRAAHSLALFAIAIAAPAAAQTDDTVSRAVVQPLPPAASADLNAALLRLANDRRDVDALIAAGLASLQLDDVDAAIGFLGRAKELSPQNPRIAEGMGAAYVRGGRPVEALRFFGEADQAGIGTGSLWADRGLAYDLVGQNAAAQAVYTRALSIEDDGAIRQRLALSYAISGQRQPFEDTLRPLLDERDFAAYRTRAFGLAVLGEADEAIEIARAVMPRDLAGRIEPYLRFMPRLTRSQQAAAANLGIYPSAARIGRDDPRIASAAGSVSGAGASDVALEPRGAPLGSPAPAGDSAAVRSDDASSRAPRGAREASIRAAERREAEERSARAAREPVREVAVQTPPPPQAAPAEELEPAPQAPAQVAADVRGDEPDAVGTAGGTPTQLAAVPIDRPDSAAASGASFDLAQTQQAASIPVQPTATAATQAPQPTPALVAAAESGPLDLADAFADFAAPTRVEIASGNAVDISTIEPVREKEEVAPPPPPAPRRIWLQLGIGQNRSLLRGDWRLKYRKFDVLKGKGPFVTPLGQTNRLLAGPFDSQAAAREALNALAAQDVDSFIWTSPEGQQIDDLR